ncbi:hypothetical protein JEQ37_28320, partial [Klebsiella pneumoniae]|uniref:hypothetical protein n=1 Tax=Klebsiella pneumoniae TaxID=573 RepID=UPI001BADF306
MSNPPFEFVIRYHDLSPEQVRSFIDDAFHRVDLVLEKQLSDRPGFFIPTCKSLTTNPSLSEIAIAVYNTYAVTEMIKDQLGVLGIFRPKTTKCSGGPAVCGLQRG